MIARLARLTAPHAASLAGSFVARVMPGGGDNLLRIFLERIERQRRVFITYHVRPMDPSAVRTAPIPLTEAPRVGIVIQGGVKHEQDFTVETVRLYGRLFPEAVVIVSLWEGEEAHCAGVEEAGAVVIVNRKPDYAGIQNINLQIVSSRSGVQRARELGCEFVLKTRSDQRLYNVSALNRLLALIRAFPAKHEAQRGRIVGSSLGTFTFRMYGLSDLILFGHVTDMETYWSAPLDERRFSETVIEGWRHSLRAAAEGRICEVYLAAAYLERLGRDLRWTLEDSWDAFARHFCVIDCEELDLFWPKYGRLEFRYTDYGRENNPHREMSFADWLSITAGRLRCNESILDVPTGSLG